MFSLNTLDVTDRKERGLELHNVIVKEVKAAVNSKLFIPIPNLLILTEKQYESLEKAKTGAAYASPYAPEDKLYNTPYNCMEIRIDKKTKLTFKEAMELDDKAFTEWEKANDA